MNKSTICTINIKSDKVFEKKISSNIIDLADTLIDRYNSDEVIKTESTPFINSYKAAYDTISEYVIRNNLQNAEDMKEVDLLINKINFGTILNYPIIEYCITCCPIYNETILHLYEQTFLNNQMSIDTEEQYIEQQLVLFYMLLRVHAPGLANEFFIAVKKEFTESYYKIVKNVNLLDSDKDIEHESNNDTFESVMSKLLEDLGTNYNNEDKDIVVN